MFSATTRSLERIADLYMTRLAAAIGRTIEDEIPDHDHLTMYTPDFLISAPSGNMVDENKPRLSEIVERVLAVLPPANSEAI
ncbi:hypothetical protein SeLEV6574_g03528 [Synchytrium endobioticum]|uniref:Uncharacterized protein n=1 Tax=Synchytrium endobioticum TaxID=286115 RepID=A0A507D3C3_9FUNG|nr:hypothetical protein SeLEV6574_g03528 [Synchytrium endobioticum]